MQETITLACVTQNRIKNMQRLIPKAIDYVDRVVVVDGFSVDGTKEWLESYSSKILVVQRKWDDSFANQYNEYLKHVHDGWILIMDDDEVPSQGLLKTMRPLVDASNNGENYSIVEYRSHAMRVEDGIIIEDAGPQKYWRQIFFKYWPRMKYVVDLHQAVTGTKNLRYIRRNEIYYHLKSDRENYMNATRNWWIAGIWLPDATEGIKCPEWYELKSVVTKAYPHVKVYRDFDEIMIKGNMKKEVKDYFYKIKDVKDEPEKNRILNEYRAYFHYYFVILHPEEKE